MLLLNLRISNQVLEMKYFNIVLSLSYLNLTLCFLLSVVCLNTVYQLTHSNIKIFPVWIKPLLDKYYPLLLDESVQFITTDNELKKVIGVYYTLSGEGRSDKRGFWMRCENVDTNQWSYCIGGCTVISYNTQFLNNVPADKVKHWIITKTCTHLKIVCNNVTVLNFNFSTDYSPGNENSHQDWLRRYTAVELIHWYDYSNLLLLSNSTTTS